MEALRSEGWDIDIIAHHRRGGMILGLCGGYQMLGQRIADPNGLEGTASVTEGLGLLDVETTLTPSKALRPVRGDALGAALEGYEMHLGETLGPDCERPFALFDDGRKDGASSADGTVLGTYVHGLLANADQRHALLSGLVPVAAAATTALRSTRRWTRSPGVWKIILMSTQS